MGERLLHVDGVSKSYGDHRALDGVDLTLDQGEICGLLGPNGAGKTSLVSIIAGLRRPDAGTVTVDGVDVTADPAARAKVGLAAQETSIYPTLAVRANLELMGGIAGYSRRDTAARIDDVADILELGALLDRKARHLSGGEKRRLHAAMAMLHRPRLLLLDEPTTGVDIATRSRLLGAIRELVARDGCAVLYSTHYLPEIEEMEASVAIIDRGRLLARGTLDDLIRDRGSGAVELSFDGPVPDLTAIADDLPGVSMTADGAIVRFATDRPGPTAAAVLARLGDHAHHLSSMELNRPNLEAVFLAVTGRAFSRDDHDQNHDVTAEVPA